MAAHQDDKFVKVGNPGSATTLNGNYTVGDTTVTVTSTTNWPTDTGIVFAIDTIGADGLRVDGTYNTYQGTVASPTSITNVSHISGSGTDRNYTAGATTRVYIIVASEIQNRLVDGLIAEHNQDGTHDEALITSRTEDTNPDPDADFVLTYDTSATALKKAKINNLISTDGWIENVLPAVSSVTHNGNRSYTVAFASSVASTLSEGMKLEFTKTVAGNGYMGGAFNGSSHYFTKTTPSGTLGTVTNNFTIEAVVQPTSYGVQYIIAARGDSSSNNALGIGMLTDGRVFVIVVNGGAANYRRIDTYQSLPLNKKTHVTASWTSGTVVIYFDGVSVPVATATTGGTAPTTAGTGGDWSIGRFGGASAQYFTGYISNVAVFDAVLSAATIRQHATYKLLGSETNCIGAWSLDNTPNDQSSAGNNLTATGGVGFTAMTPHGQLGDGVQTTKAVGLVMAVSGTDVTVQVPEGCTIPTTGGITSVAYSTQANPFGWVSDKGRWEIATNIKTILTQSTPSNNTYYFSAQQIYIPVGRFMVRYSVGSQQAGTTGTTDVITTLSTSSSAESEPLLTSYTTFVGSQGASTFTRDKSVSVSTATTYYLITRTSAALASATLSNRGDVSTTLIAAIPSGL